MKLICPSGCSRFIATMRIENVCLVDENGEILDVLEENHDEQYKGAVCAMCGKVALIDRGEPT